MFKTTVPVTSGAKVQPSQATHVCPCRRALWNPQLQPGRWEATAGQSPPTLRHPPRGAVLSPCLPSNRPPLQQSTLRHSRATRSTCTTLRHVAQPPAPPSIPSRCPWLQVWQASFPSSTGPLPVRPFPPSVTNCATCVESDSPDQRPYPQANQSKSVLML